MNIFILSCGVFEPELNKILKEIKDEKIFTKNIEVKYYVCLRMWKRI